MPFVFDWSYFRLSESKGSTYWELDILLKQGAGVRAFKKAIVDPFGIDIVQLSEGPSTGRKGQVYGGLGRLLVDGSIETMSRLLYRYISHQGGFQSSEYVLIISFHRPVNKSQVHPKCPINSYHHPSSHPKNHSLSLAHERSLPQSPTMAQGTSA